MVVAVALNYSPIQNNFSHMPSRLRSMSEVIALTTALSLPSQTKLIQAQRTEMRKTVQSDWEIMNEGANERIYQIAMEHYGVPAGKLTNSKRKGPSILFEAEDEKGNKRKIFISVSSISVIKKEVTIIIGTVVAEASEGERNQAITNYIYGGVAGGGMFVDPINGILAKTVGRQKGRLVEGKMIWDK